MNLQTAAWGLTGENGRQRRRTGRVYAAGLQTSVQKRGGMPAACQAPGSPARVGVFQDGSDYPADPVARMVANGCLVRFSFPRVRNELF